MNPPSTFVSIAAYRDPDLVPTIADCLARAWFPERLRFGICWQHGPEETLPDWCAGERFRVLDVDWRDSRGACWARAQIMTLYDGEDYYLQLDSHHRFADGWDAALEAQAALATCAKPILTTYAAGFSPAEAVRSAPVVTRIEFDCFTPEAAVLTRPGVIVPAGTEPIPARFVSAHFLFAPGSFVGEVPYDPALYFIGEEITLAVRAFTHGYDLFHPARHILWHEYTREGRRRHWDDHTHEHGATVAWHDRDAVSRHRVAQLLSAPWVGALGLGDDRTLSHYEAYAGVSFARRRLTAGACQPPGVEGGARQPTPPGTTIHMGIARSELPAGAVDDPDFWYVGVHDAAGQELDRQDAQPDELRRLLAQPGQTVTLVRRVRSDATPRTWTVLPHSASRGWLTRVTHRVEPAPRIFVSIAAYRDPDLVPTIADCLARARHPERLRFGVCWQHGREETLPGWLHSPQFSILDVPWQRSGGTCWARAEIARLWDGEEWYLQLDSHHRFAPEWDATLLAQANQANQAAQAANTTGAGPVLSAPAPAFLTGAPPPPDRPWRIELTGFGPEGIPLVTLGRCPERSDDLPLRARLVCGHFMFAPGSLVADVPPDPDLYLSGEEISTTLRAYTHGYELFHPGVTVLWHNYSRADRILPWGDNGPAEGAPPWFARREAGRRRIAEFLAAPHVGPGGLGEARSPADYEAYAGLSFRHHRMQDHTARHAEPPNPPADPDWPARVRDRQIEIEIELAALPAAAIADPAFWYVGVHDAAGGELHRRDLTAAQLRDLLACGGDAIRLVRAFASEAAPASWTVRPFSASAGWCPGVTGAV